MLSIVLASFSVRASQTTQDILMPALPSIDSLILQRPLPSSTVPEIGIGCKKYDLFNKLRNVLAKPSMAAFVESGDNSAVAISFDIFSEYESNSSIVTDCPFGLVSAMIYLSVAQEPSWKHRLLYDATHILFSRPGAAKALPTSGWPVNLLLIDTLYRNTQLSTKSLVSLRPATVFAYNWFIEDSPCECLAAYCFPYWLARRGIDVLAVGRDLRAYRSDSRGCFRPLGFSLVDSTVAPSSFNQTEVIADYSIVLEVSAMMRPEYRAMKKGKQILFPGFPLSNEQTENFRLFGVDVIPDDSTVFPPPERVKRLIDRNRKSRKKQLVYVSPVAPAKGQLEFLDAALSDPELLHGFRLLFIGKCDENHVEYCSAFDDAVARKVSGVVIDWVEEGEHTVEISESFGIIFTPILPDINPPVIYEAMWGDVPFLVNANARVSEAVKAAGRFIPWSSEIGSRDAGDFKDKTNFDNSIIDGLTLFLAESTRKWKPGTVRKIAEEVFDKVHDREWDRVLC